MGLLTGKRAFILGVANHRSLAWGIAKALHAEGCELAFGYFGTTVEKWVRPLAEQVNASILIPCDVGDDASIDSAFEALGKHWDRLDILVHAVAFARIEDLSGTILTTSREGWREALEVSAYSLIAVTRRAVPMMTEGGSVVTLTYHGAQKVVQNYNVMGVAKAALECSVRYLAAAVGEKGIRVNAVSAGPVRTLASSAIGGFKQILEAMRNIAPLRRTVTQDEVGTTGLFLCSPWASGITGEVLYVDAGANILAVGKMAKEEPAPAAQG
jgi:enoyl-[acyl-carrier protein] reductase I